MFAEELSGNAGRRRQEQNRARRRQAKQEKQNRASAKAAVATKAASPPVVSAPSEPLAPAPAATQPPVLVAPTEVASVPQKPSAVSVALEQRQIRQEAQLRLKSARCIQSIYRAHRSNIQLLKHHESLLTQRLSDLSKLREFLLKSSSKPYTPPPATAAALVRQLLFLTKSIHYKPIAQKITLRGQDDVTRLHQVLQMVVLPGMQSDDENMDAIGVWLQSIEGRFRLNNLLRLTLVVATNPLAHDTKVLTSIPEFIRTLLGVDPTLTAARHVVIRSTCRPLLLSIAPINQAIADKAVGVGSTGTLVCLGSPMDLIIILRHYLLFVVGGSQPIPPNSVDLREGCISSKERAQADVLFLLTLEAVQTSAPGSERRRLQTRMLLEILTVPLLTWKISNGALSKLLEKDATASGQPNILMTFISCCVEQHGAMLSAGRIDSILPSVDVSLKACPATNTQCLMANLVQLGRICPCLNGSDASKIDYPAATLFYRFMAILVDAVPLGTLSSRESEVEWISDGKGHHTPIVLNPVVLEQCKGLVVDSYVRRLFMCAIDDASLKTDEILQKMNDRDQKHEKDLLDAGRSATNLAAKEARIDRSKGFFNASKWARKLTKGMSSMLSSSGKSTEKPSQVGSGSLMDTSAVSKGLASGKEENPNLSSLTSLGGSSSKPAAKKPGYTPELLYAICQTYGAVLARWGGGGRDERVADSPMDRQGSTRFQPADATTKADACTVALLNVICFSTKLARTIWGIIQSDKTVIAELYAVIDTSKGQTPVRELQIRPLLGSGKDRQKENIGAVLLYVFVCALSHMLIITDDVEIHDMGRPLPLHQLRRCIQTLKRLLYRAYCLDGAPSPEISTHGHGTSNYFGLSLIYASSKTMRDLYDRSSRRPLCVPKLFIIDDLMEKEIRRCKKHDDYVALLKTPVLRFCPYLVSFKRRLKLFERIVTTSRIEIQGVNDQNPFNSNPLKPGIPVRIMRGRVLEDGLLTMNNLGRRMRERIAVQYLNEAGAQEVGIDAGGLFKEFWTDLSTLAFNPNYALFSVAEGAGNCLYPNPSSRAAHGQDHITLFEFLGRILGKALYEGITIHPQFAHFFLSFLRGDYNFLQMLPDLSTMDPQLYTNLMFLKTYEGDAEDLCLTFTVADNAFGGNREIPLIPNGANVPVTNSNKQRYIGLVAKHYVVDRQKEQAEAFTRGLWEVIDKAWLRLFNEPELQVLISGPSDGKIDVADMRSNTRYAGGYTGIEPTVNRFWSVVASFNSKQQAALLRFVTSSPRPPPLGFSSMNPPFTIQRVGILRDSSALPTASTCFNVLKLPTYSSEKVLKERLLYAIESGAGFELS